MPAGTPSRLNVAVVTVGDAARIAVVVISDIHG